MSRNPFVFQYPITTSDMAYYRESRDVDRIVNGLLLGDYYTLIGPRYSGTSSMVWDILQTARVREEHCNYFYIDFKELATCLAEESLFQGIGRIGQERFPDAGVSWSEMRSYAHFREALAKLVKGKPARLIVAFDNLDSENISFEMIKSLARCARVLYNQRLNDSEFHKLSVLIGGSQSPYALSTGSGSPFNIAERYWLHDLNAEELEQFIHKGEQIAELQFDASAISRIAAATEGDKYFIQRICHVCVDQARAMQVLTVTEDIVGEIMESLVSLDYRKDRCFTSLIKALTTDPELTEIVVALLDGRVVLANECKADMDRMRLTGILKVEENQYCFRNEVFSRFLSNRKEMLAHGWKIHKDQIEQTRKLNGLQDVALGIASALDPVTALQRATELVLKATESDLVAVFLLNKTDQFSLEAVASVDGRNGRGKILVQDENARKALTENKPITIEDEVLHSESDSGTQVQSRIWLPLRVGSDVPGVMIIAFDQHHDFSDKDERTAYENMSSHLATAVARTRLLDALQQDMATLSSLYQVSTKLRISVNPQDVLEVITASLYRIFRLATCTIGLLDKSEEHLHFLAHEGLAGPTSRSVSALPKELWHKLREEGQPISVGNVAEHPELARQLERQDLRSFTAFPLRGREKFLGILTLSSTEQLNLDKSEWDLITALTDQAAVAIESAQLFQEVHEVRKSLEMSLKVLTHQLRAEPAFVTNTITTLLAGKLGPLNEEQHDRLEKAQRRLDEHHELIDNINIYGRLKGGKIIPQKKPVQPSQVIRGVIASRRTRIKRQGLTLEVRLKRLPLVQVDRGMIEIAFVNLLDNSIKFTPRGGRILVEAWPGPAGFFIAIDDTGVGIPPAAREKVFEEYYQVEFTLARVDKGTGLGLYIAKELVHMHGGRITVVDKDGPGTRIEVMLPR